MTDERAAVVDLLKAGDHEDLAERVAHGWFDGTRGPLFPRCAIVELLRLRGDVELAHEFYARHVATAWGGNQ